MGRHAVLMVAGALALSLVLGCGGAGSDESARMDAELKFLEDQAEAQPNQYQAQLELVQAYLRHADDFRTKNMHRQADELLQKAQPPLERALQIRPQSPETQLAAARWYDAQRRFDMALKHFDQVRQLDPSRWRTYASMAACYNRLAKPDREKATAILLKGVKLMPDNADLRFNLAVSYFYAGKFREAWQEIHYIDDKLGGRLGSPKAEERYRLFRADLAKKMPEPSRTPMQPKPAPVGNPEGPAAGAAPAKK